MGISQWYYRYALETGLYMLDPWERWLFSTYKYYIMITLSLIFMIDGFFLLVLLWCASRYIMIPSLLME